jgi:hypothetical protein
MKIIIAAIKFTEENGKLFDLHTYCIDFQPTSTDFFSTDNKSVPLSENKDLIFLYSEAEVTS